jgi:ubiquinone/menaquinone biosynthesis C-methylase UbiE
MDNSENRYGYPSGQEGEEMLDEMNECHAPVALWALTNIEFNEDDVTLDIGCGGGINICRIHKKSPKAKSYGVDYSNTSVKKSKMFNKKLVDSGCVEVYEANVLDMPFDDNKFDVVTAFETVYFWPSLEDSFTEVKRILKPGGKFLIELGSNGDDGTNTTVEEDPKMEGFSPYDDQQLKELLEKVNFSSITINIHKPDNKKLIKAYDSRGYNEELVDDSYENPTNTTEENENREWLCIIAEK